MVNFRKTHFFYILRMILGINMYICISEARSKEQESKKQEISFANQFSIFNAQWSMLNGQWSIKQIKIIP